MSFKYNLVRKSRTCERRHTNTSTTIQDTLLASTHWYSNNASALTVQTITYQYKNTTLLYSTLTKTTARELGVSYSSMHTSFWKRDNRVLVDVITPIAIPTNILCRTHCTFQMHRPCFPILLKAYHLYT